MMARLPLLLLLLSLLLPGRVAAASVVETEHVRAELLAYAPQGLSPGKPIWLGLALRHQPGWHTYWKNPGDSGLPTSLGWDLPSGAKAGEIAWPTPQALPFGPLLNYGYAGDVLLPVPIDLALAWQGADLRLAVRADWLVCQEICVPEWGEFVLHLPAGQRQTEHAARFAATLAALPQAGPPQSGKAQLREGRLLLPIEQLPAAWRGRRLQVFVEQGGVIDHAGEISQQWQDARLQLGLPLAAQRSESPSRLDLLVHAGDPGRALRLSLAMGQAWPAPGSTAPLPPAGAAATASTGTAPALWLSLGLALLGGLLLNLMPCVFPVLSLKIIGFSRSGESRAALLAGGLAYGAGVLASMLLLGGVLLVLRAGGAELGWGFQLQSPPFVAGLALLFTLIALNLFGLFEVGTLLPGRLAALHLRHPLLEHGLTGVLAVLVASPCSAPFMGAALGSGLTLPAAQAMLVFLALGIGLALPYLAACLWPGLAARLPRPGPWMASFRAALGFPMLATVLWLAWVLGQQNGLDAMVALLGCALLLALALWLLQRSPGRPALRWLTGATALGLLLLGLAWLLPQLPGPGVAPASPASAASSAWQPWTPQGQAQLLADGRPLLVDFTAAWCVTCQYNKRTTLEQPELLDYLAQRGAVLLRADWTRRDAAISAELARLGRNAVPVYALYDPGSDRARLLSELPSIADIQQATAHWPRLAGPLPSQPAQGIRR